MTLQKFEEELQTIDKNLNIPNKDGNEQAPDMAGIYYKDIFITGIPSKNIYEESRSDYVSDYGVAHKNSEVAIAQVKGWLDRIDEELEVDADFRKAMAKK